MQAGGGTARNCTALHCTALLGHLACSRAGAGLLGQPAGLHGYRVQGAGYWVAWLQGFMVTGFYGYRVAWLQACMVVQCVVLNARAGCMGRLPGPGDPSVSK
jgi:hypothetical protein